MPVELGVVRPPDWLQPSLAPAWEQVHRYPLARQVSGLMGAAFQIAPACLLAREHPAVLAADLSQWGASAPERPAGLYRTDWLRLREPVADWLKRSVRVRPFVSSAR